MILSILDFAIGFEIDHGPAIEVRAGLLKSEIDNALDEGTILALVLKGCFTSQREGSCRSLHERMLEGCANRCDGGINLPARCVYEPSICFRNCADFIRARIKIHGGEHGMNQRAEPPPTWTLGADAMHRFDLDACQIQFAKTCASRKRGDRLDLD